MKNGIQFVRCVLINQCKSRTGYIILSPQYFANRLNKGGFTCTVAPHQSNAIARIHLEANPIKECESSKANAYIVDGYHSPAKIEQIIDSIV